MQDCDFIPEQYHQRRALTQAIRLRAWCLAALLAMMGLWFVSHRHELASVQVMMVDVGRQHEQVGIHLAKKQTMEAEQARLRDRQWLIEHLDSDAKLDVVFSDISRRMPDTVVLIGVSVHCPSLSRYAFTEEPAPGAAGSRLPVGKGASQRGDKAETPAVDQITMTGIARDIPEIIEFAASLEQSSLFSRVRREMKKEKATWAGRRVQEFTLTCDLTEQVGTQW